MTLADRKAELVRRGQSIRAIADDLGLTYQHVRAVLHGERRSPRVEAALAEAMDRRPEDVFPPPIASAA